jgi:hypothetical protein
MPTEMVADILTKPLREKKFLQARELLLNWSNESQCEKLFSLANHLLSLQMWGCVGKSILPRSI